MKCANIKHVHLKHSNRLAPHEGGQTYLPRFFDGTSFDGSAMVLICNKKLRVRVLNNLGDVNVTVPLCSPRSIHDDNSIGPAKISAL